MNGKVIIKKGREKPILQQHPWIFSGAIAHAENANPGDIVTVYSHDNKFLARGYWNPKSQIQVRILAWHDEEINDDWWRQMLKRAIEARRQYTHISVEYNAYRLVNAENDYLPGLIVDRYGDWLVLQALTLGIDQRKHMIAQVLANLVTDLKLSLPIAGVYERSDVIIRGKEGLELETGVIWGKEPPEYIEIYEGLRLNVDVRKGHKTGFYLDQRHNHESIFHLTNWMTNLKFASSDIVVGQVLNLFSYTGAFGLHALETGASIINIDSSRESLELAEGNVQLNFPNTNNAEFIQADVFDYVRDAVQRGEQYDVIVCDPPKFAHNAGQVEKAARGYKDLNLHCFKLIKPGGYLMTFSCSGAVSADLFQKIVFGALADSGRQAQILKHLGPGDDHPVALTFPEGAYLKGLLLRVY